MILPLVEMSHSKNKSLLNVIPRRATLALMTFALLAIIFHYRPLKHILPPLDQALLSQRVSFTIDKIPHS